MSYTLRRIEIGQVGYKPGNIAMESTNTLAEVTAAGYLANDGQLLPTDIVYATYDDGSGGPNQALFTPVFGSDGIITLTQSEVGGDVIGEGPTVAETVAVYKSTNGKKIGASLMTLTNNTVLGVLGEKVVNYTPGNGIDFVEGKIVNTGDASAGIPSKDITGAPTNYNVTAEDLGCILYSKGTVPGAVNLPDATDPDIIEGFYFWAVNNGVGDPSQASLAIAPEDGQTLVSTLGVSDAGLAFLTTSESEVISSMLIVLVDKENSIWYGISSPNALVPSLSIGNSTTWLSQRNLGSMVICTNSVNDEIINLPSSDEVSQGFQVIVVQSTEFSRIVMAVGSDLLSTGTDQIRTSGVGCVLTFTLQAQTWIVQSSNLFRGSYQDTVTNTTYTLIPTDLGRTFYCDDSISETPFSIMANTNYLDGMWFKIVQLGSGTRKLTLLGGGEVFVLPGSVSDFSVETLGVGTSFEVTRNGSRWLVQASGS